MRPTTEVLVLALCLAALCAPTPGRAGICCSKHVAPPGGGAVGGGNGGGAAAPVARQAYISKQQFLSIYGKVNMREIPGDYQTTNDVAEKVGFPPELLFGQDQVMDWFRDWDTTMSATERATASKALIGGGIIVLPTANQYAALDARRADPQKFSNNPKQVAAYNDYLLENAVAVVAANDAIEYRAAHPHGVYSSAGLEIRADDPHNPTYVTSLVEQYENIHGALHH